MKLITNIIIVFLSVGIVSAIVMPFIMKFSSIDLDEFEEEFDDSDGDYPYDEEYDSEELENEDEM